MSKEKDKKKRKKGSQLVIRVEKSERDAFVQLCDRLDTSAARELRRFMREFVASHASADAAPTTVIDDTLPTSEVVTEPAPAADAGGVLAPQAAKRGRRKVIEQVPT